MRRRGALSASEREELRILRPLVVVLLIGATFGTFYWNYVHDSTLLASTAPPKSGGVRPRPHPRGKTTLEKRRERMRLRHHVQQSALLQQEPPNSEGREKLEHNLLTAKLSRNATKRASAAAFLREYAREAMEPLGGEGLHRDPRYEREVGSRSQHFLHDTVSVHQHNDKNKNKKRKKKSTQYHGRYKPMLNMNIGQLVGAAGVAERGTASTCTVFGDGDGEGRQREPAARGVYWLDVPYVGAHFVFSIASVGCPLVDLEALSNTIQAYYHTHRNLEQVYPARIAHGTIYSDVCLDRAADLDTVPCPGLASSLLGHTPRRAKRVSVLNAAPPRLQDIKLYSRHTAQSHAQEEGPEQQRIVMMLQHPSTRVLEPPQPGAEWDCRRTRGKAFVKDTGFHHCLAHRASVEMGCYVRVLNNLHCKNLYPVPDMEAAGDVAVAAASSQPGDATGGVLLPSPWGNRKRKKEKQQSKNKNKKKKNPPLGVRDSIPWERIHEEIVARHGKQLQHVDHTVLSAATGVTPQHQLRQGQREQPPQQQQRSGPKRELCTGDQLQVCTANAVRAIQDHVAFVGLTELWDASLCLFHAAYGGIPRAAEFQNRSAHSEFRRPKDHQTFWDPFDFAVYAAARKKFVETWKEYASPEAMPPVPECQHLLEDETHRFLLPAALNQTQRQIWSRRVTDGRGLPIDVLLEGL